MQWNCNIRHYRVSDNSINRVSQRQDILLVVVLELVQKAGTETVQ